MSKPRRRTGDRATNLEDSGRREFRSLKQQLRDRLARGGPEAIADLASIRKRVLGTLVSLTYDREPLIAWRAVEAMGIAADRVAAADLGFVRSHLRRLHWLLSEECGGFCPYAPQAMAEVIRRRPRAFGEFASIVTTLLDTMAEEDLVFYRNGILWAIGRLAAVARPEVEAALPHVRACLDDPDPQIRGMAVWCLVQAGERDSLQAWSDLVEDDGPVHFYEDGRLDHTTVGALAARVS